MRFLQKVVDPATGTRPKQIAPAHRSDAASSQSLPSPGEEAYASRESGRFAQALQAIDTALRSTPGDVELQWARVSTLEAWGRYREAFDVASRAELERSRTPAFEMMLGWLCFRIGKLNEAETQIRKAVAQDSGNYSTHANLAMVLQIKGRVDEATASYARALELKGDDAQCLLNLGVCKVDQREIPTGEALIRQAIEIDSNRVRSWTNLGVALALQDRHDAAFEAFERADRIGDAAGDDSDNFINFGLHLREAGRTLDAIALYEKHLPYTPSLNGHNDYAFALLTAGRLVEGWNHYEFRWTRAPLLQLRPGFQRPMWQGQDLEGKVILLRAEQGFGDIIHFVRYAGHVKALGAIVLLQVREGLQRLAQTFAGVDRVLDRSVSESLPHFDFYANLPSLPRAFHTTMESIPADIPYVHADAADIACWASKLGGHDNLRVGLAWAGSLTHTRADLRSMRLSQLEPILRVDGVQFVSLQKGAGSEQATVELLSGVDWVDAGLELADFADTAAVIEQLDLVICVDTAVAHLTGAMGKPVWVMMAQPADFRWLEGREDTPWYPTMRLFRQSRRGDWSDVVERVRVALEERVRNGPPPRAAMKPRGTVEPPASLPWTTPAQLNAGHRPGLSAVAETRVGILQYLPDEPIVGDAIGWYGEYLQPLLDLLERVVRAGATMMEVGAGVGSHAVFLGRMIGEAGHLFLYESRPVHRQILRQNLAANEITNVTVMRRKLGSVGEEQGMVDGVPTSETLDELQLERLDWLKVNTDVDALDVLAGGSETLWRLRPKLLLAAQDEPALGELTERAREFGYRCWRMETPLFDAGNFNWRETDIWEGRTALALLAIPEEIDVDVALDECVEIS